jgi:hypothetical protein
MRFKLLALASCACLTHDLLGETVTVDATAQMHAIDPRIYGVAFGSQAQLTGLNAPLNRSGGNTTSTYNWQANASNHAADWYFESIPDGPATPAQLLDSFISTTTGASARALITIPMMDWVAAANPGRSDIPSFSQVKYGAQTGWDPYLTDAGNGILQAGGLDVTGNDPHDAYVAGGVSFQQGLVSHLIAAHGLSNAGGVAYYLLDNESSIWQSTHRDIHPVGAHASEISAKMLAYAAMVKAQDPQALVLGPEEWGWDGYFYSGYDQQYAPSHAWTYPDHSAIGMDYIPYLLSQFAAQPGPRLLDILTVHWYPQGGEFSDDVTSPTQLLRNRSTRSLWDPTYVDQSWINDTVMLIPRLKAWVSQYDPGLQIGLTEYNWGAESDIGGATAQADVLGILGREGCDLATRWTAPDAGTPVYLAMQLYRNYDGALSAFGEESVGTTVVQPDNLAAFAALRASDGALTVMLVHKELTASDPTVVALAHFNAAGSAQVWQLTSSNAITRLANATVANGQIALTLPAQSITLLVIPTLAAAGSTTTGTSTTSGTSTSTGTGSSGSTVSGSTGSASGSASASSTASATSAGATASASPAGGGGGGSCGLGGLMGLMLAGLVVVLRRSSRTSEPPPR